MRRGCACPGAGTQQGQPRLAALCWPQGQSILFGQSGLRRFAASLLGQGVGPARLRSCTASAYGLHAGQAARGSRTLTLHFTLTATLPSCGSFKRTPHQPPTANHRPASCPALLCTPPLPQPSSPRPQDSQRCAFRGSAGFPVGCGCGVSHRLAETLTSGANSIATPAQHRCCWQSGGAKGCRGGAMER